ncbi:MAG: hypothetical protein H0T58_06020 [Gemmatimonadales bacterium]|jgi:hypothetical protein|nr:hypothetical protein [Gemmatimonadales bacterium]
MFESVKARLEKLFRDHSRSDPRAYMALLREALLEAKVGVATMRSALVVTEREILAEQRQLADAERRGRLAAEVPDGETVTLAERFALRHRERIAVLERKLTVQRDELALAEREVDEMLGQYRGRRGGNEADSIQAAWRDLEAAGEDRPDLAREDERLQVESDSKLKERAVEAQLAFLKKKFGKQP